MNSNQQPANQSQLVYEDEISLVDIVKVLLRRKNLILRITALVVCIGLIYAFSAKRVYQVETILLPPSFENIHPLNVLNSNNVNSNDVNSNDVNSNDVNSNDVFDSFISNINSRKLRKEFFDKFKILEIFSDGSSQALSDKEVNDFFEEFSKALKVKTEKKSSVTRVTLEGVYEEKVGHWLDSFVAMANQETINQLIKDLQSNIDSKIKSLKINISSKRSIYKQRREDELGRLQEALQIAKELNIKDHLFVPNLNRKGVNAIASGLDRLGNRLSDINNLTIYMKGTKVLQAEINALKNRKSGDIHIDGLRDLQEQLTRLNAIKIDKDKLKAVIVDKKAIVNVEPIWPPRILVAILSIILGGMLGIFAVFIMEFISNFKKQVDNVDVV